jgi:copper(I)-binding protein
MRHSIMVFTGLTLALAGCGGGGEPRISVEQAWARETLAGQSQAAVYLRVANRGTGPDRLVSASTPRAAAATLHDVSNDGGIHRMRAIDGVEVAAGASADFVPGGKHVMLSGVSEPLRPGTAFPLNLRFERSGERQVTVSVRRAGETMERHQ